MRHWSNLHVGSCSYHCPSCICCLSNLTDQHCLHRETIVQSNHGIFFFLVLSGISTHRILGCLAFPAIFLWYYTCILHTGHPSSTTSHSCKAGRLAVLYPMDFVASTKSLRSHQSKSGIPLLLPALPSFWFKRPPTTSPISRAAAWLCYSSGGAHPS